VRPRCITFKAVTEYRWLEAQGLSIVKLSVADIHPDYEVKLRGF
jgi:hypothetical protein